LIGVIAQSSDSDGAEAIANLLQIPGAFVSLVVAAAIINEVHRITGGEKGSFNQGLDAAFERLGAVLSTTFLLVGLAFAAAFAGPFLAIYWLFKKDATIDGRRDWLLAIIPFALLMYLAVRWAFNTQAVIISGKQNWAALDDSADAVRNSWWRAFAILLVVGLIALGPSMMAQLATFLPPLAAAAIISGVSALIIPFAAIAQTLLYYDLKIRTTVVPTDPVPLAEETADDDPA
jgi:hypothetical protein